MLTGKQVNAAGNELQIAGIEERAKRWTAGNLVAAVTGTCCCASTPAVGKSTEGSWSTSEVGRRAGERRKLLNRLLWSPASRKREEEGAAGAASLRQQW